MNIFAQVALLSLAAIVLIGCPAEQESNSTNVQAVDACTKGDPSLQDACAEADAWAQCTAWDWVQDHCASDAAQTLCTSWGVYFKEACGKTPSYFSYPTCRSTYAAKSYTYCVENACVLLTHGYDSTMCGG